jgi:HAD superfamily hydrolase (TIGR01509 family)
MIKAVLFDMNGVIISDESIHESAFKETAKSFGVKLTHQNYLNLCAGKTDRLGYQNIAEYFEKELPIEQLIVEKAKLYKKIFPTKKKACEGVTDLIKKLSDHYILAVTSGASKEEIKLVLQEFELSKYFKIIISADDIRHSKPNPEPYLITCEQLQLRPQECVVIEDSPSGVISAKTAGCHCIGITSTHTKEELHECDLIINSFTEINAKMMNEIK